MLNRVIIRTISGKEYAVDLNCNANDIQACLDEMDIDI